MTRKSRIPSCKVSKCWIRMQGHVLDTLTWMHSSKKSILTVLDCGGVGGIFSKLQSKPGCVVECIYAGSYLKRSLAQRPKTLCVSNLKQTGDQLERRNINQTICIDPEMLTLAQLLERDVLRGSSNADLAERRGWGINHTICIDPEVLEVPFSRKPVQVMQ